MDKLYTFCMNVAEESAASNRINKEDAEADYNRRVAGRYSVKYTAKEAAAVEKAKKHDSNNTEEIKKQQNFERMICRICDVNHSRGGNAHHKNTIRHIDNLAKANKNNSDKIHCEACNCYHAKKGKSQHIKTKKHMNNINKISE